MHNVTSGRTCKILTLEIAVPACVPDGEVRDGVSALLTEGGICSDDGIVLDWRYVKDDVDEIAVASSDPEEGEIFHALRKTSKRSEE